ncbi:MAG: DUF2400 domain-containing protein, partial [Bacteroidales bacterium]|nr:DUF2400 domain-containing protein [Bacteroidales bacterium]
MIQGVRVGNPDQLESGNFDIFFSGKKTRNLNWVGFLTATLAWGQRPTIIRNARKLVSLMDNNPIEFLLHTSENEWARFLSFKHRTFNGVDCIYFLKALQNIYVNRGGLE